LSNTRWQAATICLSGFYWHKKRKYHAFGSVTGQISNFFLPDLQELAKVASYLKS